MPTDTVKMPERLGVRSYHYPGPVTLYALLDERGQQVLSVQGEEHVDYLRELARRYNAHLALVELAKNVNRHDESGGVWMSFDELAAQARAILNQLDPDHAHQD